MGKEEEDILKKLNHDINGLRQSLENTEILAKARDKKVVLLENKIDTLENKIDTLTKQIEALTTALFKNDLEPDNTILKRIQKIEAFMQILDKTRYKLTGNIAGVMWIITATATVCGFFVMIYNAFKK